MRYALVHKDTKRVENLVEWDGNVQNWQPPPVIEAITADDKPATEWVWDDAARDYKQVEFMGGVRIGELWDGVKFFEPEKPQQPPFPTNEVQSELRRVAYLKESDPIFFMTQRGEATQEEWVEKIEAIKARLPYYYDDNGNLIEA